MKVDIFIGGCQVEANRHIPRMSYVSSIRIVYINLCYMLRMWLVSLSYQWSNVEAEVRGSRYC